MKSSNRPSSQPTLKQRSHNRLWWHRKKMGYTQQTVAQLLGHRTTTHISAYERGRRIPKLMTALKLSMILCIPVESIYPQHYQRLKRTINQRREKLTKENRR